MNKSYGAHIDRLLKEERLLEAGSALETEGNHRAAAEVFERACAFMDASRACEACGNISQALLFARLARSEERTRELLPCFTDAAEAQKVATSLEAARDYAVAAKLFEAAGCHMDAARTFELGGDPERAAAIYQALGDPMRAGRTLEAAFRREPQNYRLAIALGKLLAIHKREANAAKFLQTVPRGAFERREALAVLSPVLRSLGLEAGAEAVLAELRTLGGILPEAQHTQAMAAPVATALLFGRYRPLREVSRTASAEVIEAFDTLRECNVAIKRFSLGASLQRSALRLNDAQGSGRDAHARFEREARVMAELRHPNIVALLETVAEGPALIMPWMKGGNLAQTRPLSPRRAVEVICGILSALSEGHRLGILHRDVKPANILFDESGTAKLADFGAAHLGDLSRTATAGLIGTFRYMSPEQKRGEPATVLSDIYGAGTVLLELLTGDVAVPSLHDANALDLDAKHWDVLQRMISKVPGERFATALEARKHLEQLVWPDQENCASSERASKVDTMALSKVSEAALGTSFAARPLMELPLAPRELEHARTFARATHPALQTIVSLDPKLGTLKLAPLLGAPPAFPLGERDRSAVEEAMQELRDLGYDYGSLSQTDLAFDAVRGLQIRFRIRQASTATEQ
jgi:eukaryotic-like serine/threonine-protein kinase